MIHVIDEMHLNDFKEVHTIKPCDLYARYGKRTSPVSFDSNIEDNVPMNLRKLDSLEYLEAYDSFMNHSESYGTVTESQGNDNKTDNKESDNDS